MGTERARALIRKHRRISEKKRNDWGIHDEPQTRNVETPNHLTGFVATDNYSSRAAITLPDSFSSQYPFGHGNGGGANSGRSNARITVSSLMTARKNGSG